MKKVFTPTEKMQKAKWQHKNATKFDYRTIAGRLKTVSLRYDIHPISMVAIWQMNAETTRF